MRRAATIFAAVAHLLLLDAVAKELAAHFLKGAVPVSIIPGFFDLAYVENRGCAWGMFQGASWPLAAFGAAALAFLAWKRRDFFFQDAEDWRRPAGSVAECLLYAGITGNIIDRVFRGYVIDFLDFHVGSSHFPCFNIADICITVAAALIVAASFGNSGNGGDARGASAAATRRTA